MVYCARERGMVTTPVYDGPALVPESVITGPAVIEHPGTTIVVLSGQTARIDQYRHTHIFTARGEGRHTYA
jgi:N-methylhydantoinase A